MRARHPSGACASASRQLSAPRVAAAAALLVVFTLTSSARSEPKTPVSYGEVSKVDTPILRIPFMRKAPEIDGVMAAGEWDDASALSCFWYDYTIGGDFRYLAPEQTQLQVYAAYDKENLYFAYTSPVYPKNSWLKARGRFPDVENHPLFGILWDDHLELELRPYGDLTKAFELGLFKFVINPLATACDYYMSNTTGVEMKWKSRARIRSVVDGTRWVVEIAVPLDAMVYGNYAGKAADGTPFVRLPPADGMTFRTWMVRAIGGNGAFFNASDAHIWNTTKMQLILDSRAPSFQLNELGPIMDDTIDVSMTVRNHSTRSETVRLGFFVENAGGTVYSSYQAPELKDGLLELVPGETRRVRLRQPFPGITKEDNLLWFDVRSAGQPARILYRTRLCRFHAMDGGAMKETIQDFDPHGRLLGEREVTVPFKERRVDVIAKLRPPRRDFELYWGFSPYTRKVSMIVDRGIHGASDESKRAREARVTVMTTDEEPVRESTAPFSGDYATTIFDVPELTDGETYKVAVLLFDENKRIVGEQTLPPFTFRTGPWMRNTLGLDDGVWEPFTAIRRLPDGFETLKHTFAVAPSGLPAQVWIKPDPRELPLDRRGADAKLPDADLLELGRGPQLRGPMRLQATVKGRGVPAEVVEAARLVREWKSEFEYASTLRIGPLTAVLKTVYDCDGAMRCQVQFDPANGRAELDRLELVMDVDGLVDMVLSETGHGSMAAADVPEMTLPDREGVVWDSAGTSMELRYNKFIPYFWFGSGDRGWTWFCDSDEDWRLDRDGSSMSLERDRHGKVSWRVSFVNHTCVVDTPITIAFTVLTHPAKPKPPNFRHEAWYHCMGRAWSAGYSSEPYNLSEEYYKAHWHTAAQAPKEMPYEKAATWRKDEGPFFRYGVWRNVQGGGICAELDQEWEDKATWFFERHIRLGRRVGWWMDEYFPVVFGRSNNLAAGNAYLRRPGDVRTGELPWHSKFLTTCMRDHYKRLARISAANNVPQRQIGWSNNEAHFLESLMWSSLLVEGCGGGASAYEIDQLTAYPESVWRYMAKNGTGLVTTLCAEGYLPDAGDDKRFDRQVLGRCLLNDIGFTPSGPHAATVHTEQGARLLALLEAWGFFSDKDVEKLPYWRNGAYVRVGDRPSSESKVYVTAYRRPKPDGTGTHTLFVVLNESDGPVSLPLTIVNPVRVLGGSNALTAGAVRAQTAMPDALKAWWTAASRRGAEQRVLKDLESGEIVPSDGKGPESYGPVYIPYHDYRIFCAESEGGK